MEKHDAMGATEEEEDGGVNALEFRSEARIWYLYLEDAEREAKPRVERWQAGLDFVLVFAGLFAAVVSSFIIDARRDLPKNSEQNLLSEIRDTLRDPLRRMSIVDSETVQIPVSQKWIHVLWLLSLYMILFSIITGVLAKAWLTNLVPPTARREAADAYHWYRTTERAELWHFIPLLIQQMIASFLFLAGLIIQAITDDRTLGHALLAYCISACAIYLAVGVLPWFIPSSLPFNTPLSDILRWLGKMFTYLFAWKRQSDSRWQLTTDINECLAKILYTKLIKSPKPRYVDEAVKEIALPSFPIKWINYLCRNSAPYYLLEHFKQRSSKKADNVTENNEILASYLLAFYQLVNHLEENLTSIPRDTSFEDILRNYQDLLSALRASLEPGYPLHRWNNLPESLRPLAFGLRTQILYLFGRLPETYWKSIDPTRRNVDFCSDEMSDSPWRELASQSIPSSHRLHFMLAACRGVQQREKNVKTTSAFILSLCLAKAGCIASETGRTSEWAGSIQNEERTVVNTSAQEFLTQLYAAMMAELEDVAAVALNEMPGIEIGSATPRLGILDTLVSTLTLPHHALRIYTIKMLKRVPDLQSDMFDTGSIKIISNMTVYEDEDAREDGLQILATLVKSSAEKMLPVTTALLASVESGFNHEPQQRLRTVAFVRTIWDDSSSPFYSLVGQFIPGLVEVALNADSTDVRQPALHLAKDVCAREFLTEIKSAIPKTLSTGLDSPESGKRYHIVNDLSELLKDDGMRDASEKPPYAFAWYYTSDLVVDVFPVVFEKIVRAAIHDDDSLIREKAKALLKNLSRDGRVSSMLKVDALTWLETAAVRPGWWVRHSAVLVSETFIDQLDLTNEKLVKKLVEWAGTDEDDVIRRSSLRLISTICKDRNLSPEMLEVVKSTILSVKDIVIGEGNTTIRSQWVHFLSNMVNHEVVPILLELYIKVDSDSEMWKSAHQDFLMLGEHENDPEYIKALESALPQNLMVSLYSSRSDWPPTMKWIKLLVALSKRQGLKESVDKILKGIAKAVRDGIEAEPLPKPLETDSNTQESPSQDKTEFDGAMDYMSQSTLKLPLRRLLFKVGWVDRSTWVDILATIAAHFPLDFQDAYNILFQIAQHDSDTDVQYACLKSLILLAKQPVPRELINDTINYFDDFSENSDWRIRFSYTQLLSSVGVLKGVDLSDEVLKKLSTRALLDADDDCRSEAVNTFSNLLEIEDSDRDGSPKERYRAYVKTMVKDHFHAGIVNGSWKVRQSWIRLAGTQVKDACSLFFNVVEFQALSKLIEVVVKEEPRDTTFESQNALHSERTLPKAIRSALKLDAPFNVRLAAVNLFGRLIGCVPGRGEAQPRYENLLGRSSDSQIISRLADIVIKDVSDDVRIAALRVLKAAYKAPDSKLNRDVLIAIPPMVATLTAAGKAIVVRLTGSLAISDSTAATIVHALTPMLRNTSSLARATAIELLLKLYTKHCHSKLRLSESAIPEIISLAFDDKDDVGGTRITAIQLLVALSSGPEPLESVGKGKAEPSTAPTSSVLRRITPHATKFMALLQVERLRPSVVELLSLMSLDPTVRQTIMLRIASMAFGPETLVLEGHVELLSRLISDGAYSFVAFDSNTLSKVR
ncbi:hypothetical protein H1R20_g3954, partial [Candolleomyces eurysporus]